MNALDDSCKSVIMLVEGEAYYTDAHCETNGYHVVCALPEPLCSSTSEVQKLVKAFCHDRNIPHTFYTFDDALDLLRDAERDSRPVAERMRTPLTVITARAADAVQDVVDALLRPSPSGPYCLVAVLDLTHRQGDTKGQPADPSWAWLLPEQSYRSELKEFYAADANDAGCNVAPLHMYCCYPLVRDCGMQCSVETFVSTSSNKCTFDSILRELAFKAGQVPKYGN